MNLLARIKNYFSEAVEETNLDWRVVAVELNEDLLEERKRRFAFEQENYDLKQELAAYKYKENFDIKARLQGEM